MALLLNRVSEILINAMNVLQEYQEELASGVTPKRAKEIERDAKLVNKIVNMAVKPYVDVLKPIVGEDVLRNLGLL